MWLAFAEQRPGEGSVRGTRRTGRGRRVRGGDRRSQILNASQESSFLPAELSFTDFRVPRRNLPLRIAAGMSLKVRSVVPRVQHPWTTAVAGIGMILVSLAIWLVSYLIMFNYEDRWDSRGGGVVWSFESMSWKEVFAWHGMHWVAFVGVAIGLAMCSIGVASLLRNRSGNRRR